MALARFAFASLVLASCGRSELLTAAPCSQEGATLACANACGDGVVTCRNGFFSACEVGDTTRDCENACGSGSETCHAGVWGSCEVAPVAQSCSDQCGAGDQTCQDGAWGPCEVRAADLPCEDACGQGLQHCENDQLGVCQVPVSARDCSTACGAGHEVCADGAWRPCDAPQPKAPVIKAVIRDFQPSTNSDFERPADGQRGDEPYLVEPILGADDTPVYSGDPRIHTVTSADTFYAWYHDGPSSIRIDYDLQLAYATDRPGYVVFDSPFFFPIDNQGWGNDGNSHNYHFTLATELSFRYAGGEVFSSESDDDSWLFVNRHLAINLGGLHEAEGRSVSLDEHAAEFEITPGETYPIHVFFAERHTVTSVLMFETTTTDPGSCQ
jgi:fibro-slime domain-containing protein